MSVSVKKTAPPRSVNASECALSSARALRIEYHSGCSSLTRTRSLLRSIVSCVLIVRGLPGARPWRPRSRVAMRLVGGTNQDVADARLNVWIEVCFESLGRAGVQCLQRGDHLERPAVPALDGFLQTPPGDCSGSVKRDGQIQRRNWCPVAAGCSRRRLDSRPAARPGRWAGQVGQPPVGQPADPALCARASAASQIGGPPARAGAGER